MVNIPLFTGVLYIPGWLFGISEASTVPFPSLPVIPPGCLIGMFLGSSHKGSHRFSVAVSCLLRLLQLPQKWDIALDLLHGHGWKKIRKTISTNDDFVVMNDDSSLGCRAYDFRTPGRKNHSRPSFRVKPRRTEGAGIYKIKQIEISI